nr:immunoglobulin heavy chain junction region [Macaca mulatta]MOX91831.1 immunoglobulin heavy chain junction region [Macaca mulatta]MOX94758.1 immunoglobulin heavy chain junction region [Macaca mulatta]MOX95127.1 immunoglobulin heavy chain junction region [Macaca mulatta]MOX96151.1 immunoglobulin heavy chain junction region [Macaca mulatta]
CVTSGVAATGPDFW